MRIGLYTECLTHPHTGVEVLTRSLAEGLGSTGNEVVCFHSADPRHPRLKNVRHHLFAKPLRVPFYRSIAALVRPAAEFDGLDVLHMPYPSFPYARKPRVPVVVTVHDIIPVLFPQFHNWKRAVFFRHFLPRHLRQADAIIAISEATKADLIRTFGLPAERITVVHDCLPPGNYRPDAKKEQFILSLGTLEPRKNIEGLLRAYALLKASGRPEKLVIAGGKGWGYQPIFRLIRELGLENDVTYAGYVSDEEKLELYRKAKLFVYPSFYEGFGLPVLEAMASGTPVVTSNTSSLPEVAGDAAVLVNPAYPADIAQGMESVLASPEKYKKLVKAGLKQAARFAPKRMVRETLAVYEGVVH